VLRRVSKRREVSNVVAITPDGRLYARHVRTSVSSSTVISALRYFRRKIGTPLLVILDRLNAHRSQVTTDFIAAHPQDFAVAYLPAYAPELVWGHLSQELIHLFWPALSYSRMRSGGGWTCNNLRGARRLARAIARHPCIRRIAEIRTHDAVMRIAGAAPGRRAHSQPRRDGHVRGRVAATSDRWRPKP
jgi:hypothetical protein